VAAVTQPLITREEYAALPGDLYMELMQALDEVTEAIPGLPAQSKKKELEQSREIYDRITEIINNKGKAISLPPIIHLNNPELAFDIWVMWRADERRHLPSEYLSEPTLLFDDVMQIENIYNALDPKDEA